MYIMLNHMLCQKGMSISKWVKRVIPCAATKDAG